METPTRTFILRKSSYFHEKRYCGNSQFADKRLKGKALPSKTGAKLDY